MIKIDLPTGLKEPHVQLCVFVCPQASVVKSNLFQDSFLESPKVDRIHEAALCPKMESGIADS